MQELQRQSAPAKAEQDEFVEFFRAGDRVAGAFECVGCGYGAVVRAELLSCPVCSQTLWERSSWSPFARALNGLGERLRCR
jgi:rubrerythrin